MHYFAGLRVTEFARGELRLLCFLNSSRSRNTLGTNNVANLARPGLSPYFQRQKRALLSIGQTVIFALLHTISNLRENFITVLF